MIEVWCEGCREWWPLSSVHGWQFPRRGSHRYSRRVRSQHPHG
uniref:Uncharacterized protein n=1 Tax=Microbacterium phage Crisis TaxID=3158889 RepID=A0AAU8GP79_9CAUD